MKIQLLTACLPGGGDSISWETRLNIATGAARGLAFLHTTEKQVIYRDFKASNILLDKVKLSYFFVHTD